MNDLVITAYQAERELARLLNEASIDHISVFSSYDDALDCQHMVVLLPGFIRRQLAVPYHALKYDLNQFSDEVLAPFVAKLKQLP